MNLAIFGPKNYEPQEHVRTVVRHAMQTENPQCTLFLTGMQGASRIAENYTREIDAPRPVIMPIPRGKHEPEVFFKHCHERNEKLVKRADVFIAFTGELDPNTRQVIDLAIKARKPVFIIGIDAPQPFVDDVFGFIKNAYQVYFEALLKEFDGAPVST